MAAIHLFFLAILLQGIAMLYLIIDNRAALFPTMHSVYVLLIGLTTFIYDLILVTVNVFCLMLCH